MNLTDYYMTADLHEPPMIHQREFGIIRKGKGMWRHLSFQNIDKLRSFLMEQQPLHVYFSAARYKDPSNLIMAEKGWLGADLIFDIDNDHLTTPTLAEAAYHINKLDYLLEHKFGLKDRTMVYSGSRGYHNHVRDESIQSLDNHMRAQIAECFTEFKIVNGKRIYNKDYVGLDVPVTCDTARLIRLPGSIHGKTMQPCRIIRAVA